MSRTLAQRELDEANGRIARRCIDEDHDRLRAQNAALLEALKRFTINDLADERIRYGLLIQAHYVIAAAEGEA